MKKLRWSDLSLVSKIVIEVGVLAALMFTINMLFYVRINNSMQEMDDVYASNAQITELGQVFEDVQDSMYQYLKVKSSQALMDYYQNEAKYRQELEKLNDQNIEDSVKLLEKKIRKMSESYLSCTAGTVAAKRGRNVEKYKLKYDESLELYSYIQSSMDELNKHISEIEQEILRLSDKYEAALNLIRTVPGFNKNPLTAIQVLSEIGGDMPVFPTAKHLVSCAGCCSRNDKSDRKIKSTRISCAGSYFKPVLVQIANALIKSKKHFEFTTRYKRIKTRRGHKKAIIARCRMILTAIWHILTDLKPYTSDGFLESRPVKKEKVLTTSQALNLLRQRGYLIKDEPSPVS